VSRARLGEQFQSERRGETRERSAGAAPAICSSSSQGAAPRRLCTAATRRARDVPTATVADEPTRTDSKKVPAPSPLPLLALALRSSARTGLLLAGCRWPRSMWRDHFATQQSDPESHVSLEKEESRYSSDEDAEEDDHHGPVRWPSQPTPDGSPAPSILSSYLGSTASQSRDW
jgi:hypothetical protein